MGKTILIVDDDRLIRVLLEKTLQSMDYHVVTAASAEEAFESLLSVHPDLIVSDILMPGMNGYEFCQRVRAREEWSQIPFVFLSIKRKVKDKIHGLEAGGDDYIQKPFHIAELVARIEARLRHTERLRKSQQAQELLADEAIPISLDSPPGAPAPAGAPGSDDQVFDTAMVFFERGQFDLAYDLWTRLLQHNPEDAQIKRYANLAWQRFFENVQQRFGSLNAIIIKTFSEIPQTHGAIPQEAAQLWGIIDGSTTLQQLLEKSPLSRYQTCQMLLVWINQGWIRVREGTS